MLGPVVVSMALLAWKHTLFLGLPVGTLEKLRKGPMITITRQQKNWLPYSFQWGLLWFSEEVLSQTAPAKKCRVVQQKSTDI